jgi:hypothetical protein
MSGGSAVPTSAAPSSRSPCPEPRSKALSSLRNSAAGAWKASSAAVNTRWPRGVSASDAMRMGVPTDRWSRHAWARHAKRSSLYRTGYVRAGHGPGGSLRCLSEAAREAPSLDAHGLHLSEATRCVSPPRTRRGQHVVLASDEDALAGATRSCA